MNLARVRTPEYSLFYCQVGSGLDIHLGCDYAIEFDYGLDYAELIEFGALHQNDPDFRTPGFKITRRLNALDRENIQQNLEVAEKVKREFSATLNDARLRAKVVHVRLSLDRRVFFIRYNARNPLNLQRFVKPLEDAYGVKVNLWQVGIRGESRLVGCVGHCGREACCCSWMKHEHSVNLKMAKDQGISLNPASLNGTCNRLKCCLKFENSIYVEAGKNLPEIGTKVICADHDNFKGVIINRDILRGRLTLRSGKGEFLTVDVADVVIRGARQE